MEANVGEQQKILVVRAVGFIGSYVRRRLLERGNKIVGPDNINARYSVGIEHIRRTFEWFRQF